MRWWRRGHNNNGEENTAAAKARAETEARELAAKRATPMVEKMADRVHELPVDEFADRVARAFRRRPA
jgi:hypothetical protein